jgi:hypothetical protein
MKLVAKICTRISKTPCIYRVRPRKRRKPYLRYLWLDLHETKTGINHFKNTIGTM